MSSMPPIEGLREEIERLRQIVNDLTGKRDAAKGLVGGPLGSQIPPPVPNDEQIDSMTEEEINGWCEEMLVALPPGEEEDTQG